MCGISYSSTSVFFRVLNKNYSQLINLEFFRGRFKGDAVRLGCQRPPPPCLENQKMENGRNKDKHFGQIPHRNCVGSISGATVLNQVPIPSNCNILGTCAIDYAEPRYKPSLTPLKNPRSAPVFSSFNFNILFTQETSNCEGSYGTALSRKQCKNI